MIPEAVRISAGFLVKDKKVFVAQRSDNMENAAKWEFPGGKLNGDEQYDAALKREFKEEFDIDITIEMEIGSAEIDREKIYIFMFFLVNGDADNIKLKVHKDSKFVNFSELNSLDLTEADKNFIQNFENEIKQYID